MPWGRFVALWLAGFIVLQGIFQWEAFHEPDFRLASWLQSREVAFNSKLLVVDIPKGSGNVEFRNRVGRLMQHLAARKNQLPERVGLDMWFDLETPETKGLIAGIDALTNEKVLVVGAVNIRRENHDGFDTAWEMRHWMEPIGKMDGVGHNYINYGKDPSAWPFFAPCPGGDLDDMPKGLPPAMAVHLAGRADMCPDQPKRRIPLGAPLLDSHPEQVLGYDESCASQWRRWGGECLANAPETRGKILILGRFADDPSPYPGRPGPEIVAWAVNDLLQTKGNAAAPRHLLNDWVLHLLLALATAMVALLLFAGLLRFLRRWRLMSWRIAMVAGIVALLVPAGMILIAQWMQHDFTQVLFPIATMIWTLGLATYVQSRAAIETERRRQAMRVHEHTAYDVMVSYRHTHADWVKQTLLPMLKAIRRHDGEPLSVFWDAEGIRFGADFTSRLAGVIHESRVFLAVLTPDYFDRKKPYCRWEMQNALQREPHGTLFVLPIAYSGFNIETDVPSDFPQLSFKHCLSGNDPELAKHLATETLNVLAQINDFTACRVSESNRLSD